MKTQPKAAKANSTETETESAFVERMAAQLDWTTQPWDQTPERGVAISVNSIGIEPHRLGVLQDGRYFVCDSVKSYDFKDLRDAITFFVWFLLSECRFCVQNLVGDAGFNESELPILVRYTNFESREYDEVRSAMLDAMNRR